MLVQSYKGEPASDFIPRLLWTPCTSAPRLPTRCRAKRRLFRFERRRRCLPSRRSVLSRCAASDAPKCLFAFTDGPKALSAALEAAHCLLSARTAQCAAGQAEIGAQMNTRRQRNCLLQPNRKRRRVQRERLRGGLPVVNAPTFAKKQNASALVFHPSAQRRVPATPHMECRYARGVPEKQACADAACAYVREDAASTAAVLLGKVRLRSRSVRADSARALCAFRRDVSETPRQKAAKRFSLQTKKASAARSRRRLSFTRFSSRRGRTEG